MNREMLQYNAMLAQLLEIEFLFERFTHDVLVLATIEGVEEVLLSGFKFVSAVVILNSCFYTEFFSYFIYEYVVKEDDNSQLLVFICTLVMLVKIFQLLDLSVYLEKGMLLVLTGSELLVAKWLQFQKQIDG